MERQMVGKIVPCQSLTIFKIFVLWLYTSSLLLVTPDLDGR